MSVTQDIIADYIERLTNAKLGLAISEMPDSPSSYALKHAVGEVLVQYSASQYAPPTESGQNYQGAPTKPQPQQRQINIQLTVVLKSLRGPNGTNQKIDEIRDALKQFRPRHCLTQVWFKEDGFISEKQGVWQYGISTAVLLWEK